MSITEWALIAVNLILSLCWYKEVKSNICLKLKLISRDEYLQNLIKENSELHKGLSGLGALLFTETTYTRELLEIIDNLEQESEIRLSAIETMQKDIAYKDERIRELNEYVIKIDNFMPTFIGHKDGI